MTEQLGGNLRANLKLLIFGQGGLVFREFLTKSAEMLKTTLRRVLHFCSRAPQQFLDRAHTAHTFAYRVDGQVIGNDLANVTVLAISAADLTSGARTAAPHRGCGPLSSGETIAL